MMQFNQVTLARMSRVLIENFTQTIFPKQKIGLIGANGSGKSTLFAFIRGELSSEQGELLVPTGFQVAHVAQETPALARTAIDYVLDGHHALRDSEAAVKLAEDSHDGEAMGQAYADLAELQPERVKAQAAKLLSGLGFLPEQFHSMVSEFSGGWRMRLNLAQALIQPADILLLDEPTNHLDLEAICWLEDYCRSYPGTIIMISHDREFLDNTVSTIFHLYEKKITAYQGNYSTFENTWAMQLALQEKLYEKQQKALAHMQDFVNRFRAKATKAKQAQSRLKAMDKMEKVAAVQILSPFSFEFFKPEPASHPLLELKKLTLQYDQKLIFDHAQLQLSPTSRIGLLGPNGAGKTTLLKIIAGRLEGYSGKRILASQNLKIGYFEQHQVDYLDSEASPVLHLQRLTPKASIQECRNFLGGFAFHGDTAIEPIRHFSGGEKARLALALLVWQKPNLLLMDEPTNHLDMEMRQALELALQSYQGALVVVSHDRYLLRTTVDEFYLVANHKVTAFPGDLEDYQKWVAEQFSSKNQPAKQEAQTITKLSSEGDRRDPRRLRDKADRVEAEINKLHQKLDEVNEQMADSRLYEAAEADRLKKLQEAHQRYNEEIARLESEWYQLIEKLGG